MPLLQYSEEAQQPSGLFPKEIHTVTQVKVYRRVPTMLVNTLKTWITLMVAEVHRLKVLTVKCQKATLTNLSLFTLIMFFQLLTSSAKFSSTGR